MIKTKLVSIAFPCVSACRSTSCDVNQLKDDSPSEAAAQCWVKNELGMLGYQRSLSQEQLVYTVREMLAGESLKHRSITSGDKGSPPRRGHTRRLRGDGKQAKPLLPAKVKT